MPRSRYYKTLFVGSLYGQSEWWKNEILKVANKVDQIVQMGNIVGINEVVTDTIYTGDSSPRNTLTVRMLVLYGATSSAWTQLVGPNEILVLSDPDLNIVSSEGMSFLRRMWFRGVDEKNFPFMDTAAVNKGRLVTHGGMTYGEWISIGKPKTAYEAAKLLNEKYNGTLEFVGSFRTTGRASMSANPIFCDPMHELYLSWIMADEAPPFGQMFTAPGFWDVDAGSSLLTTDLYAPIVNDIKFTSFGSLTYIDGAPFYNIGFNVPQENLLKFTPQPHALYVEKMPVVDVSDLVKYDARTLAEEHERNIRKIIDGANRSS